MPARILLVDDDQRWLCGAMELFASAGYQVRGAWSFGQAREAVESFEPDLLITDIRLQEYNGLHLLIRSRVDHPRMACLIVSGYDDPVLEKDARQQGASAFVVKPVDPGILLARAADALAGGRARAWQPGRTPIEKRTAINLPRLPAMPPARSGSVGPRSSSTT